LKEGKKKKGGKYAKGYVPRVSNGNGTSRIKDPSGAFRTERSIDRFKIDDGSSGRIAPNAPFIGRVYR
jgi:hypothetical protein